jgi:hypothetical protein
MLPLPLSMRIMNSHSRSSHQRGSTPASSPLAAVLNHHHHHLILLRLALHRHHLHNMHHKVSPNTMPPSASTSSNRRHKHKDRNSNTLQIHHQCVIIPLHTDLLQLVLHGLEYLLMEMLVPAGIFSSFFFQVSEKKLICRG